MIARLWREAFYRYRYAVARLDSEDYLPRRGGITR